MDLLMSFIFMWSLDIVLCSPFHERGLNAVDIQQLRWTNMQKYIDFFYTAARMAGLSDTNKGQVCDDGWVTFKGTCYFFVDTEKRDWDQAKEHCASEEAHLVTIETAAEDSFLRSFCRRLFKKGADRSNLGFYIGATDKGEEGTWKWYTDNSVLQYNNLRAGQTETPTQDCAIMWGDNGYDFDWADVSCSDQAHFICEKVK